MSARTINHRNSPIINLTDSNRGKFGVVHRVPPLIGEPEWVVSEGDTRAEAIGVFFNEMDARDYCGWRNEVNLKNIPSVHYSSATDEWATPQAFFDEQNSRWHFTLDVCATPENAKCVKHYTKTSDGLHQTWTGERCWMNPPYGRTIGQWMKKAYEESRNGTLVVCLVPARTDTNWWHDYATKGDIRFLRGRLKFGDGKNSAPFPSALVVFSRKIV